MQKKLSMFVDKMNSWRKMRDMSSQTNKQIREFVDLSDEIEDLYPELRKHFDNKSDIEEMITEAKAEMRTYFKNSVERMVGELIGEFNKANGKNKNASNREDENAPEA